MTGKRSSFQLDISIDHNQIRVVFTTFALMFFVWFAVFKGAYDKPKLNQKKLCRIALHGYLNALPLGDSTMPLLQPSQAQSSTEEFV